MMTPENEPNGFHSARDTAEEFARDKDKTTYLLDEAMRKAEQSQARLAAVWEDLQTLIRMARAWVAGRYREVSWQTIVFIIAGIVYFVNPFDFVPDFIPGAGLLDDATVIGFVIKSLKREIDQFLVWESQQDRET